jgi:hypothetical protein
MPDNKPAIDGVKLKKNTQAGNIHAALTNPIINLRRKLRF